MQNFMVFTENRVAKDQNPTRRTQSREQFMGMHRLGSAILPRPHSYPLRRESYLSECCPNLNPPRPGYGNNPRIFLASWTRLMPRLKAAARIEIFCFRLTVNVCMNAPSRMRNNLSITSVSVQKKLCKSCTHSK